MRWTAMRLGTRTSDPFFPRRAVLARRRRAKQTLSTSQGATRGYKGAEPLGWLGPLVIGLLLVVAAAYPAARDLHRGSDASAVEPVVQRFLSRPDEPLTQFRATRHLEAQNDRFNKEATMDVITELLPDGKFTYTIQRESGSTTIRNRVMRGLLENEKEMAAAKDPSRFAVTPANYDVTGGEMTDEGTVKLLAKPRRKDAGLIDGAVFITTADSDIVRVEGRLVKTPSFWTTRVDVVKRYARIAGARVPIRLDTTAHIRFAGASTMTMTYSYEMVNGVAVAQ